MFQKWFPLGVEPQEKKHKNSHRKIKEKRKILGRGLLKTKDL